MQPLALTRVISAPRLLTSAALRAHSTAGIPNAAAGDSTDIGAVEKDASLRLISNQFGCDIAWAGALATYAHTERRCEAGAMVGW